MCRSTSSRTRGRTIEKTFTAQVQVGDKLYGHGTGRSKKEAEQQAAETAYRAIAAEHGENARAVVVSEAAVDDASEDGAVSDAPEADAVSDAPEADA